MLRKVVFLLPASLVDVTDAQRGVRTSRECQNVLHHRAITGVYVTSAQCWHSRSRWWSARMFQHARMCHPNSQNWHRRRAMGFKPPVKLGLFLTFWRE